MSEKNAEEMFEVEILAHGSQFGEKGQVVSVNKENYDALCMVRVRQLHGGAKEEFRMAKPVGEKVEAKSIPLKTLTQGEATALGIKNVVETPKSPIYVEPSKHDHKSKNKKLEGATA